MGSSGRPRVVVWDCFGGPIKTLDVGGLRDANGRFYNENGAVYPIVHQFRPTRHSAFYASLNQLLPPRGLTPPLDAHGGGGGGGSALRGGKHLQVTNLQVTNLQVTKLVSRQAGKQTGGSSKHAAMQLSATDPAALAAANAAYPSVAWRALLFEAPLQRVPMVWDDHRRMERLRATMEASGLPNPADSTRPVPPLLPPCAPPHVQFAPCGVLEANGSVQGEAWRAMAASGFVRGAQGTPAAGYRVQGETGYRVQGGAQGTPAAAPATPAAAAPAAAAASVAAAAKPQLEPGISLITSTLETNNDNVAAGAIRSAMRGGGGSAMEGAIGGYRHQQDGVRLAWGARQGAWRSVQSAPMVSVGVDAAARNARNSSTGTRRYRVQGTGRDSSTGTSRWLAATSLPCKDAAALSEVRMRVRVRGER